MRTTTMHIHIYTGMCVYVYISERSHSPAIVGTGVCFDNIHDNNLNNKVLHHTADFILCDMAGSSP